jgi:MFS family permease
MAAEIVPKSQLGSAYNYMQIFYRMGQIVGQPLGGFLAHPERHFPFLRGIAFFEKYPFELPCIVAAVLCMMAVVIAIFRLPETLKKKNEQELKRGYGSLDDTSVAEGPCDAPQTTMTTEREEVRHRSSTLQKMKKAMTWEIFNIFLNSALMCLVSECLFVM